MTKSGLENPVHPGRKPLPRVTKQAVNASAAPALSASLEASCNVSPDEATSSTIRVRLPLSSGGILPNMRGERRGRLARLRRLIRTGWNSQPRALASAPPTKTPPCATPTPASGVNVLETGRARARTSRADEDPVPQAKANLMKPIRVGQGLPRRGDDVRVPPLQNLFRLPEAADPAGGDHRDGKAGLDQLAANGRGERNVASKGTRGRDVRR